MPTPRRTTRASPAVAFLETALRPHADATRAKEQAAYMKTEQAFKGVTMPQRREACRELAAEFAPSDRDEYVTLVDDLWQAGLKGERDFQYAAIFVMERFKKFHTPVLLPRCKRMNEQGAWWDLVDWITSKVVSPIYLRHRENVTPVMKKWIDDKHLWTRRAAILSHLKHKGQTDADVLFEFCIRRAHEKDFFIRKAIGWALREYANIEPEKVERFLKSNMTTLSPLSVREAGKHIGIAPPKKAGTT